MFFSSNIALGKLLLGLWFYLILLYYIFVTFLSFYIIVLFVFNKFVCFRSFKNSFFSSLLYYIYNKKTTYYVKKILFLYLTFIIDFLHEFCYHIITCKIDICGNSSADRASPCQGEGRGFKPRFPLQIFYGAIAKW